MPLLIGSSTGIYEHRAERSPLPVLDAPCRRLETAARGDRLYAATEDGLFVSDDGRTWTLAGLDGRTIASFIESPDGSVQLAGAQPARVYRSTDDGDTWRRLDSFDRLPGLEDWIQLGDGPAQVRSMSSHPRVPARISVGIEAEGVYVTPDYGETWVCRSEGLHRDHHHLEQFSQRSIVASCGRGLYRTDDMGRTWRHLDTHHRQFWYTYYRESIIHDGVLYAGANDRSMARHEDTPAGVILSSTDGGRHFDHQQYPGAETTYVNAWATSGARVYAGTIDGRVLAGPESWEETASVDGEIRALLATVERGA